MDRQVPKQNDFLWTPRIVPQHTGKIGTAVEPRGPSDGLPGRMLGGSRLEASPRGQRGRRRMALDDLLAHDSDCCGRGPRSPARVRDRGVGPGSKRTETDCKLYVQMFTSEQSLRTRCHGTAGRALRIKLKTGPQRRRLSQDWTPRPPLGGFWAWLLMAGPSRADVTDSSAGGGTPCPYDDPSGSGSVWSPEGAMPMTPRIPFYRDLDRFWLPRVHGPHAEARWPLPSSASSRRTATNCCGSP